MCHSEPIIKLNVSASLFAPLHTRLCLRKICERVFDVWRLDTLRGAIVS